MNRFKRAVLMAAAFAGGSCGLCQAQESAAGVPLDPVAYTFKTGK